MSISMVGLLALSAVACGDDDDTPEPDAAVEPDAPAALPFGSPEDIAQAEQLWTDMADYENWELMPNTVTFEPSSAPHGDYARILLNDVAAADPTNLAAGSIIAKQNYASETEGDYGAVTVMYKIDGSAPDYGDWFWVKYNADGTIAENPDGVAMAGQIGRGADSGCIPCHGSADGDDYVFKN